LGGSPLSSFKIKLVAYFVLLSLIPLAATYWGFSTVAGSGMSRQVTLRQAAGLRAALAVYQEQADRAQAEAARVARSLPLRRALQRRDREALRRILAGKASLYIAGTDGLRVGAPPHLAARLPVEVVSVSHRLGAVVATVPLDLRLVRRLRRGAAFDAGDVLVLVDGTRIVASAPSLHGSVAVAAGQSATVRVAGSGYRAFAAPSLPGLTAVRLEVLTRSP